MYHNLEENELITSITIPGRAYTKKTSQRVYHKGKHHVVLPSENWEKYRDYCLSILPQGIQAIHVGIMIEMNVYLINKSSLGDAAGYIQSIGDILEVAGIITNDKNISSWTSKGRMINLDKSNPRVELNIYRQSHCCEK